MARCRTEDGIRVQQFAARRLISQTDLVHVLLNVWEGLSEHDQQLAILAAGEKRAVKYQCKTEQGEPSTDAAA